jgi:hypothetical protein
MATLKVFVLGADDPEMRRIEELANLLGYLTVYAQKDGKRVHPGNAYAADNTSDIPTGFKVVFVECQIEGVEPDFVIDHHNEGDPGYGKGPELYWEASSIGQLYEYLSLETVPDKDRVLAAMDHCLNAAVKGGCPGIVRWRVLDIKTRMIAELTGLTEGEVRKMIGRYIDLIRQVNSIHEFGYALLFDQKVIIIPDTGIGYTAEYLTAQVAGVVQGVPIIICSRENEGDMLRYHFCGDTTPETVEGFVKWAKDLKGLIRIYSNPQRGYAGGYEEE